MVNDLKNMNINPDENDDRHEEFIALSQEEQIAEGDISVSETSGGEDPQPDLDDRETEAETLGEDDLAIKDEDNPRLGINDDNTPGQ